MKAFKFIVTDGRHNEPQVLDVCVRDAARACALADEVLRRSRHHLRVEVLDESRQRVGDLGLTPIPTPWCGGA